MSVTELKRRENGDDVYEYYKEVKLAMPKFYTGEEALTAAEAGTATHLVMEKIDFSPITAAVVCCVLELGNGCYLASSLGTLASCICAFAVGFGGFCVFFQVKAAAHENSDMRIYLTIKLLCGLISALFAFFLL